MWKVLVNGECVFADECQRECTRHLVVNDHYNEEGYSVTMTTDRVAKEMKITKVPQPKGH